MRSRSGKGWALQLCLAAAVVAVWRLPHGDAVLYPLSVLASWFHHLAHGLAVVMTGGHFESIALDGGSGSAGYFINVGEPGGSGFFGRLHLALVAAMGTIGPAAVGAVMIVASRAKSAGRGPLLAFAAAVVLSLPLWVRGPGAIAMLVVIALAAVICAGACREPGRQLATQGIGVLACISCFRETSWLFRPVLSPLPHSDAAMLAAVLPGPYWFWGLALAATAVSMMLVALAIAYESHDS